MLVGKRKGERRGTKEGERGGENMPAGLLSGHITFSQVDITPAWLNVDKQHSLFSTVNSGICLCFAYVVVFLDPTSVDGCDKLD